MSDQEILYLFIMVLMFWAMYNLGQVSEMMKDK